MTGNNKTYSMKEAAFILQVRIKDLKKNIDNGLIKAVKKPNGHWSIEDSEIKRIDALISKNSQNI